MFDSYYQAMDMPADSRLIIKKLSPGRQPKEREFRWVLARYHAATIDLVVLDQFRTHADAIKALDNIIHLEEEGRF